MSKIQINELNNNSELNELNDLQTGNVVGGGDVYNNQSNSSNTNQNGFSNFSFTGQTNNAYISNYESNYPYYWYY